MARRSTPLPLPLPLPLLLLLLSLLPLALGARLPRYTLYGALENADVERSVDLSTAVEEVTVTVRVANAGAEKASFYVVAVPAARVDNLSFIRARRGGADLDVARCELDGVDGAAAGGSAEGAAFYRVALGEAVAPGGEATLELLTIFTKTLRPLPAAVRQHEDQLVDWRDSVYFFSPYATRTQTARVRLASDAVEFRTKKKPSKQSGERLRYGPYEDQPPFAFKRLRVHYKNNHKFVTFTRVVRDIEVSHWGNVAVEEFVWVEHTGARLDGPFHRVDFDRGIGASGFNELVAHLPHDARDVYYRDYIGNISTSSVRQERTHTRMEVSPRFPLFGGWKTDFYTGFNVDAQRVLGTDAANPGRFVLNTTFSTPFREAVVEDLTLRVILPEGASDIKLHVPFPVDSESRAVRKTYLDTTGRPTVVFRKTNLVHYHDDYFQVVYSFPQRDMLVEPLMLTSIFFSVFALAIVYNRVSLSITPSKKAD